QRLMLDRYAGLEPLRAEVATGVQHWRDVKRRIVSLSTGAREREQRIDLLRFQIDEIAAAELQPGEDEALMRERDVLQNADRLRQDAELAMATISGDDAVTDVPSVSSMLRAVEHAIRDLAEIDRNSLALSERATDLVVLAEDLARDLSGYLDDLPSDPERLAAVDERLSLIQLLKRKYGATIEEISGFANAAAEELEGLTGNSFDIESLQSELATMEGTLVDLTARLSSARQVAAVELAGRVETSIAELRMGRSELSIRVARRPDPDGIAVNGERVHVDESGIDDVEFLIASSAGETLRPFARIASGGETARIMLALKSILSDVDATPTLVFDEIDVGVGGRSGQVVGEKLWSITANHQVIVVTHLPQIAAFANHHLRIVKQEHGNRIVSVVEEIRDDERIDELAAMLDGTPITPTSRSSAIEMLRRSEASRDAAGVPVRIP
ncbi:MAG TPA: DNA repair protein RecN, partial [Thermomicrobiales bacterium]|nr:DNA repair protein RecN [Thermomicrobiales bacterium]